MRASSFAPSRMHVGAATDTAAPTSDALTGIGKALPIFALGAVGAVFGGTLWGLTGLLGGALAGAGAGYGVTRLAEPKGKTPPELPSKVPTTEPPASDTHPDFTLPIPSKFKPPQPGELPKIPFPEMPTFLPTPSLWIPVSVVNSRARVDMNRNLPTGTDIQFIAQYGGPLRGDKDTGDEIKLGGRIVLSRKAVTDQDPAYGVEVTELVQEHDIRDDVARPNIGQRMAVAPDQVLHVSIGAVTVGNATTGRLATHMPRGTERPARRQTPGWGPVLQMPPGDDENMPTPRNSARLPPWLSRAVQRG